jgi:hypothetical protein
MHHRSRSCLCPPTQLATYQLGTLTPPLPPPHPCSCVCLPATAPWSATCCMRPRSGSRRSSGAPQPPAALKPTGQVAPQPRLLQGPMQQQEEGMARSGAIRPCPSHHPSDMQQQAVAAAAAGGLVHRLPLAGLCLVSLVWPQLQHQPLMHVQSQNQLCLSTGCWPPNTTMVWQRPWG